MCKINMKMDIYFPNICKHEHGKNMTRLWCKIMPKTSVEQTEGNEGCLNPSFGLATKVRACKGAGQK
jgi:hypothetical protein